MVEEAANVREIVDVELGVLWTTPGIGIDRLWRLPLKHPFFRCACAHDLAYDLARSGHAPYQTSKPIDKEFYHACLEIAGDSMFYRTEAKIFYLMARAWGRHKWPVNGDSETMAKIKEAQAKVLR